MSKIIGATVGTTMNPDKIFNQAAIDDIKAKLDKILSDQTVEVIPEGYIKPTGTKSITENGTHDVTEYASVAVNVPTGGGEAPNLCGIEVTPTKDYQNIVPEGDFDGFDEVIVNPIPDEYIIPSEWQAETVYYPNDIAIYNGVYYICIMMTQQGAVLQTPDITPTWWERINGEYKGEYDSTVTYSIGDIVTLDGSVYQAIVDNPQTPPDNDMANHWTVIHKCEVEGEIVNVWNGMGITFITL